MKQTASPKLIEDKGSDLKNHEDDDEEEEDDDEDFDASKYDLSASDVSILMR